MNRSRPVAALLIAVVASVSLPTRAYAASPAVPAVSAARAVGAPCGAPVAVIGADVTPANLPLVRGALGVGPGTTELREMLADERARAHGLIPPALLGIVAVSSVLLSPQPAGAGLAVTVTRDVTRDAAATYANALLTAGVIDARVRVTAPPSQRALGTTALLGLLRAAEVSCLAIDPARRDLALREIALTDSLTPSIGPRGAAARLLFALKRDAVDGGLVAPAALAALVARDAAARGVAVAPSLQPALVAYLRDLVASRAYAAVAGARPSIAGTAPFQALVRLSGLGARGALTRGTIVTAGAAGLAVRAADGLHTYQPAAAVPVYRNGAPSALGAIRPGDTVVVTTDAGGHPTRIDATSTGTGMRTGTGAGNGATIRSVAVVGAAATGLAVRRAMGGVRIYHPAAGVPVYRDGARSALAAIRRDDTVVITTDAAGRVTRIDATSSASGTGTAAGTENQGATVHGVAAAAGAAATGLAVKEADGTRTYRPAPGLRVYRNGAASTLGAIRSTDAVTVTTNAAGAATRIDATSARAPAAAPVAPVKHGAVAHGVAVVSAAGAAALAVKEANGTRTYRPSAGTAVYRNGARSAAGAIRPTDAVTVTMDAAGAVTRIDATSKPAAAPVVPAVVKTDTGALNPALILIPLLALLLLGLLLLARRRRRSATTTTTTTTTVAQPLSAIDDDRV